MSLFSSSARCDSLNVGSSTRLVIVRHIAVFAVNNFQKFYSSIEYPLETENKKIGTSSLLGLPDVQFFVRRLRVFELILVSRCFRTREDLLYNFTLHTRYSSNLMLAVDVAVYRCGRAVMGLHYRPAFFFQNVTSLLPRP